MCISETLLNFVINFNVLQTSTYESNFDSLADVPDEMLMPECLVKTGCPDYPSLEDVWDTMKSEEKNMFEMSREEFEDILRSCGLQDIPEGYMMVNGELVPPTPVEGDDDDDEGPSMDHLIDEFFNCE